jgi:hypothetical protein
VREFNAFNTPRGNKFTQEYEVYSQRFQREDFGDDDPFDPKVLPNEYLTAPKPTHTFVYVSTIQRMARNLFGAEGCFPQTTGDAEYDDDVDGRVPLTRPDGHPLPIRWGEGRGEGAGDKLDIPIHAFDVIIADECHRGYTAQEMSVRRETINHFDAIKIGLTATPAAHSTALFGPPVFRYTVEQAILDGFLVDYEPIAIKSEVRMNGLFLKEGETVERVDTDTGQKARILWEQMLGRGTRRCDDINKSKFVVFDCFDGTLIRYFRNVSSFDIAPPRGMPPTIPEIVENIWQNVDRDYHVKVLAKRLLRIDKDMSAEARTQLREHLLKNLSMDEEDFDLTPLLEMRGGKAKARKVFESLSNLVAELNEAVAA